jgi:tripartite motif-containing protein 9/67
MEDELKCIYCNDFYCNPVLLPCFHSLCYACARQLQEKFSQNAHNPSNNNNNNNNNSILSSLPPPPSSLQLSNISSSRSKFSLNSNSSSGSSCSNGGTIDNLSTAIVNAAKSATNMIALSSSSSLMTSENRAYSINDLGSSIISDLDKLSVFSENDSGLSSNTSTTLGGTLVNLSSSSSSSTNSSHNNSTCSSRPSSGYLSNGSNSPALPPPPPLPACSLYSTFLPCPKCNRMIYMDETGVDSLAKNTCLENIVERYTESKKLSIKCQMCPPAAALATPNTATKTTNKKMNFKESAREAQFMCEQCQIYYCEECKDSFHPMRGPLAKHSLVAPKLGRDLTRRANRQKESKCLDHMSENVNYYCLLCKSSCCSMCINEESTHLNHQIQPINSFCKSQKVNFKIEVIL